MGTIRDEPMTLACPRCEEETDDRAEMSVHIWVIHVGCLPYKCAYCDESFESDKCLRRHQTADHPGMAPKIVMKIDASQQRVYDDIMIAVERLNDICLEDVHQTSVATSSGVDRASITPTSSAVDTQSLTQSLSPSRASHRSSTESLFEPKPSLPHPFSIQLEGQPVHEAMVYKTDLVDDTPDNDLPQTTTDDVAHALTAMKIDRPKLPAKEQTSKMPSLKVAAPTPPSIKLPLSKPPIPEKPEATLPTREIPEAKQSTSKLPTPKSAESKLPPVKLPAAPMPSSLKPPPPKQRPSASKEPTPVPMDIDDVPIAVRRPKRSATSSTTTTPTSTPSATPSPYKVPPSRKRPNRASSVARSPTPSRSRRDSSASSASMASTVPYTEKATVTPPDISEGFTQGRKVLKLGVECQLCVPLQLIEYSPALKFEKHVLNNHRKYKCQKCPPNEVFTVRQMHNHRHYSAVEDVFKPIVDADNEVEALIERSLAHLSCDTWSYDAKNGRVSIVAECKYDTEHYTCPKLKQNVSLHADKLWEHLVVDHHEMPTVTCGKCLLPLADKAAFDEHVVKVKHAKATTFTYRDVEKLNRDKDNFKLYGYHTWDQHEHVKESIVIAFKGVVTQQKTDKDEEIFVIGFDPRVVSDSSSTDSSTDDDGVEDEDDGDTEGDGADETE